MRPHRALAVVLASVLLASLAVLTSPRSVTPVSAAPPSASERPNIVLVLMDDSSYYLLQTMATAQRMARQGADYRAAFVADSLCCVSRAAIMTGQYPHQTQVRTNVAGPDRAHPVGGWSAWNRYGNGSRAVNVALHDAGYTTGFVGKYLNGFKAAGGRKMGAPPGWSEFAPLLESAYDGWDFAWGLSTNDGPLSLRRKAAPAASASAARKDAAYAGIFAQKRALDFIRRNGGRRAPYFLEVAVYATHSKTQAKAYYPGTRRFPAMFRDQPSPDHPQGNCGLVSCRSLTTDDLPGFGDPRKDNRPRLANGALAPAWQSPRVISAANASGMLRDQARMAQSVDRMLAKLLAAVDDNTYVILTSDNGVHVGQWGMVLGKGTAYDSDIHIPLIIVGPGVAPGGRDGLVSLVDLAPTIEEIAGLPRAHYRSGASLVPSLADPATERRRYVFLEHTWSGEAGFDPDAEGSELAMIPSYVAVRSAGGLLVRYDYDVRPSISSYAYELYDLSGGLGEVTNVYGDPDAAPLQQELASKLADFDACRSLTGADAVPQDCRDITD